MATMQEYINLLTYLFKSEGADKVADDMNKVGAAQTTTSTSALNLEKSFNSLERRMDSSVRAAQDYASIQAKVAAAVAQNPALQERANNILALAEQRYAAAARGGSLYGQALNTGQAQMQAFAAQAGILGDALTALGTKGLAGAAAIGGLTLAYKAASDQAHELGQKAVDLRKFSDTTGLSTNQVQALRIEAGKIGVSSEDAESAMQRFTVSFEELRQGGGRALEVLRRYRPELADQMQQTESTAQAFNILTQAVQGLGVAEQNVLSRAFLGRGMDPRLLQVDLGAATQGFEASGRGLSEQQIDTLKNLTIQNKELNRQWNEGFAKLFAPEILRAENQFLQTLILITKEMKSIKAPDIGLMIPPLTPFALASKAGAAVGAALADSPIAQQTKLNESLKYYKSIVDDPSNPLFEQAANMVADIEKRLEAVNEEAEKLRTSNAVAATAQRLSDPNTFIGPRPTGLADPGTFIGPQKKTLEADIADAKGYAAVLGDLMSVQERVALKKMELAKASETLRGITEEETRALIARETVQAEFAQVAPGTYERQLAALQELKAAYPGLTAAEAQRMRQLDQQLSLASAVTGTQRMAAQEAITYQNEIAKGATVEQAVAVAAKERQITQAQINTQAQQQLAAMQDQYAVASAVTGVEKIQAQEQATYNALIRQGVDAGLAMQIASRQAANAYEQINAQAKAQLLTLRDQYQVASAVTGLQKIQAQEAATIAALIREGVDAQNAMAVGAQQTANALAQVNAAAQANLLALRDQHAVASAYTTDERLAAQEVATRNNLLRQGVSLGLAAAVAAQERANAEAQVNVAFEKQLATAQAITGLQKIMLMDWREQAVAIAEATSNVERQTESLQQQNQMTAAKQRAGDDPVQGLINQQAVAYQQAYNNAINQGAEEQAALNLAKETQLSYEYKINDAIDQQNAKAKQAQEQAAKEDEAAALKYIADEKAAEQRSNEGAKSAAAGMSQVLLQLNDLGDHTYDYFRQIAIGAMSVQQALTMASTLQTQLTKIQKQQKDEAAQKQQREEQKQQAEAANQKYQGFQDQIQQLQNQRALAEARKASPEAEAQVQSQQAYAKAIADGATAAQAQQIADLTLANALAQNTSAVQSNTEALSPYYASDPRLSHLGFRAGSSALGYDPFAQPATGAAGPAALPLGSTTATGMAGGGVIPPGGLAYVGEHGPNPGFMRAGNEQIVVSPRTPYLATDSGRPVQIVQNFNAPVDRGVAAEMKISAYQAAQAGMRSLRAVR